MNQPKAILKKLLSIVFLFIFLFYVAGYYIVYIGLREIARAEMTQRLDRENYSEDETITIKIPFNLPYQAEDGAFKRTRGDFRHNGEFYTLIKQKVENDTLYIICMKDKKEKKIFNFMADIVKMSTDLPTSSSTTKLVNSLIKDYMPSSSMNLLSQRGWHSNFLYNDKHFNLLIRDYSVLTPPPQFSS